MYIQSEHIATQTLVVSVTDYMYFWRKHFRHLIESVRYVYPRNAPTRPLKVELNFRRPIVPRMLRMKIAGDLNLHEDIGGQASLNRSKTPEFG